MDNDNDNKILINIKDLQPQAPDFLSLVQPLKKELLPSGFAKTVTENASKMKADRCKEDKSHSD